MSTGEAVRVTGLDAKPLVATVLQRQTPWPLRVRRLLLFWGNRPYLMLGDAAALALAGVVVGLVSLTHVVLATVCMCAFGILGLYRRRLKLSLLDDFPRLTVGVLSGTLIEPAIAGLLPGGHLGHRPFTLAAVALVAVLVMRSIAYWLVRFGRRSGLISHRVLIVGAGEIGIRLAQSLREHPEYGLKPVGFLDATPRVEDIAELPAPLVGGPDELGRIIPELRVSQVIVAFSHLREYDLVNALRTCDRLNCEIFYVPRLFELCNTNRDVEDVRGIPLMRTKRLAFRTFSWRLKRLVDIVLSAFGLVLLAPIMAVCALAVRLDSGPGVLFRQERVGMDGRPFTMMKFRSLRPVDEGEAQTTWNIANDDRMSTVGRILRSTSLDELPQLWNVLAGHMSLVGPRPERPYFVQQYSSVVPRYTGRHRVPAGLTGWAQIHGLRGDTSIEERATFDNYYIENWSLWGDVKIIVRTVGQVLQRRGA